MPDYGDIELWNKFKEGDDYSFSVIYSKYSPKLYAYGLKFTTNSIFVEDSIQDVFSDLAKNRKHVGTTDNIQFYLTKSFKRRLIRLINKEKRYELNNDDQQVQFDISYSIEHHIILEEKASLRLQLLEKAISTLTSRQKEALYLRFTEEFEYEMISEILDMNIESCRNLICRSIRSLRDALRESAQNISLWFILKQL